MVNTLKLLLLVILTLACSACGITVIQPDKVAVVYNVLSGEFEEPRRGGTYLLGPFQFVTLYPITMQECTIAAHEGHPEHAIEARTAEGQPVSLDVTILFRIDPDRVNMIHTQWGQNYITEFICPALRSTVRDVVVRYQTEDIYGERRWDIQREMEDLLRAQLDMDGFIFSDFFLRDVNFTPEFVGTIEAQLIATQEMILTQAAVTPTP
jgi:regulator of protease activity HflC (stomatin/prohibitin superfamily)